MQCYGILDHYKSTQYYIIYNHEQNVPYAIQNVLSGKNLPYGNAIQTNVLYAVQTSCSAVSWTIMFFYPFLQSPVTEITTKNKRMSTVVVIHGIMLNVKTFPKNTEIFTK